MSIACPTFESQVSSLDQVRAESARVKQPVKPPSTARRIEANRRNARRSTGPRTAEGKGRVSRNALKHGLCATYAHLPGEEEATFEIFLGELEQEMRPRTVLQRNLFPQIANLLWRIRRLPEAEAALFVRESGKAAVDETEKLSASEVLARRFSDDPSNGFMLMGRYERSMQNALLRMIRQFHSLQKTHPTTPYADDEVPYEHPEVAKARLKRYRKEVAERERLRESVRQSFEKRARHVAEDDARVEAEMAMYAAQQAATAALLPSPGGRGGEDEEDQSQSKPLENPAAEAEMGKCSTSVTAPVTEQTHGAPLVEPMPRAMGVLQSSSEAAPPDGRAGQPDDALDAPTEPT